MELLRCGKIQRASIAGLNQLMSSLVKAVSRKDDVEGHIQVDVCHTVVENCDDKDIANIFIHLPNQRYLKLLVELSKAGVTRHVAPRAFSRVEQRTRWVKRCIGADSQISR